MRTLSLLFFAVILPLSASAQSATTLETLGDATISHDVDAAQWTIAAGGATLTIAAGASQDFHIVSVVGPSGHAWLARPVAGTIVTSNGTPAAQFGSRDAGFEFESVSTSNDADSIRLDAEYRMSTGLRVIRHVAVTNGSPTFETWTTFIARGAPVVVSDINAFQLAVPAGTLHWLNGLQGDAADGSTDTAFTLRQQDVAEGAPLVLGAQGRSSEQTVPWFAIDGSGEEFYAALMWSGAWSLRAEQSGGTLNLTLGLAPMSATLRDNSIEGPHAIFGAAAGRLSDASAALRSYVVNGLRSGRAFSPLVTYNTWFAYGTAVDEDSMRAEMDGAAALGAELFVLDAGWYQGAGADNAFDFDSGLGSWTADPARFPSGLGALADYAHGLGMKFGIWIEPERVNLSVVGKNGLEETWLAKNAGDYGSDRVALLCLSDTAARKWVVDKISTLIDTVHPDYIKWDNNAWVNCDRAGHGHTTTDGNFAQISGLYAVLDTLRSKYPDLLVENVSGGGNRLDFGMLRYSDVAWMDDRTAPSVNVRHNLEGLAAAFPPAYLLSFLTNHDTEPVHDAPDLALYIRSRMAGALGLCFLTADLSDEDAAQISHEIAIYKDVRETLSVASGALLSSQAAVTNGPDWDVLQAAAPAGQTVVIYAYQSDDAAETVNVYPTDLQPDATYSVQSVDAGTLGVATGADLMQNGVEIVQSPSSAAHILLIIAQQ